jgi:hypothetical protein
MAEHDRIWACLVEMASRSYPDDPDLAAIHAVEVAPEEQTTAYGRQADQLEADVGAVEATRLRVTPTIVGRATASMYNSHSFWLTRLIIYVKMIFLSNQ